MSVTVSKSGDEHRLVAVTPTGEMVAYSDPHTAVGAYNALAFVEALSDLVGDPRERRALRVTVDEACDCQHLEQGPCSHHNLASQRVAPRSPEAAERLRRRSPRRTAETRPAGPPGPWGVHVIPYQLDNQGWEVATTTPDGSSRQMSGPHPTVEDAEAARDFIVRLVNVHPQLHILGWDQRPRSGDVACESTQRDQLPTVGVYSPDEGGAWYVQCRNPDSPEDATSPPYPTYQAASAALDQLGLLSVATTDYAIGSRATVDPTATLCRCSQAGWRCGHIEHEVDVPGSRGPETEYRGPSLGV